MKTGIQSLPPRTAEQYADRARKMDGCVIVSNGIYEFAQGSTVITLMSLHPADGHIGKDSRRADEIRRLLATTQATQ